MARSYSISPFQTALSSSESSDESVDTDNNTKNVYHAPLLLLFQHNQDLIEIITRLLNLQETLYFVWTCTDLLRVRTNCYALKHLVINTQKTLKMVRDHPAGLIPCSGIYTLSIDLALINSCSQTNRGGRDGRIQAQTNRGEHLLAAGPQLFFQHLPQLTSLSLLCNGPEISFVMNHICTTLLYLKKLSLDHPPSVTQNRRRDIFSLSQEATTHLAIPNAIQSLSHLEEVNLQGFSTCALPLEIGLLPYFKTLNTGSALIRSLTLEIGKEMNKERIHQLFTQFEIFKEKFLVLLPINRLSIDNQATNQATYPIFKDSLVAIQPYADWVKTLCLSMSAHPDAYLPIELALYCQLETLVLPEKVDRLMLHLTSTTDLSQFAQAIQRWEKIQVELKRVVQHGVSQAKPLNLAHTILSRLYIHLDASAEVAKLFDLVQIIQTVNWIQRVEFYTADNRQIQQLPLIERDSSLKKLKVLEHTGEAQLSLALPCPFLNRANDAGPRFELKLSGEVTKEALMLLISSLPQEERQQLNIRLHEETGEEGLDTLLRVLAKECPQLLHLTIESHVADLCMPSNLAALPSLQSLTLDQDELNSPLTLPVEIVQQKTLKIKTIGDAANTAFYYFRLTPNSSLVDLQSCLSASAKGKAPFTTKSTIHLKIFLDQPVTPDFWQELIAIISECRSLTTLSFVGDTCPFADLPVTLWQQSALTNLSWGEIKITQHRKSEDFSTLSRFAQNSADLLKMTRTLFEVTLPSDDILLAPLKFLASSLTFLDEDTTKELNIRGGMNEEVLETLFGAIHNIERLSVLRLNGKNDYHTGFTIKNLNVLHQIPALHTLQLSNLFLKKLDLSLFDLPHLQTIEIESLPHLCYLPLKGCAQLSTVKLRRLSQLDLSKVFFECGQIKTLYLAELNQYPDQLTDLELNQYPDGLLDLEHFLFHLNALNDLTLEKLPTIAPIATSTWKRLASLQSLALHGFFASHKDTILSALPSLVGLKTLYLDKEFKSFIYTYLNKPNHIIYGRPHTESRPRYARYLHDTSSEESSDEY